jgi:glyoxylase-like metal-dependent hydrolase (beta-lactamase superfamily II)
VNQVITIDCDYVQPRFAAAYLIVDGDRAAFVDNNTAYAVPKLLAALRQAGLRPEQVEYVIITHVHLDHASGSAALMEACPRATLLAHPRAAPHMIDPSKLAASARQVYGAETFAKLYGELAPIPAARVRALDDGAKVALGSRALTFLHTRGHANHHFCIHDSGSDGVFTGDSFGLCYPVLQDRGLFIFPSTSPTDFDPDEARQSLTRITGTGARRAYLTHFGEVTDLAAAEAQLRRHLDFSGGLLERAAASSLADDELDAFCFKELTVYFESLRPFTAAERQLLDLDLKLNADGIAHVARKRRRKPA